MTISVGIYCSILAQQRPRVQSQGIPYAVFGKRVKLGEVLLLVRLFSHVSIIPPMQHAFQLSAIDVQ